MTKLFVWNEPYPVEWGFSKVVVAAQSVDEAKKTAMACKPKEQTSDLGEPDEVLDLPAARWIEWSE